MRAAFSAGSPPASPSRSLRSTRTQRVDPPAPHGALRTLHQYCPGAHLVHADLRVHQRGGRPAAPAPRPQGRARRIRDPDHLTPYAAGFASGPSGFMMVGTPSSRHGRCGAWRDGRQRETPARPSRAPAARSGASRFHAERPSVRRAGAEVKPVAVFATRTPAPASFEAAAERLSAHSPTSANVQSCRRRSPDHRTAEGHRRRPPRRDLARPAVP
jgi:hypothetical protein